MLDLAQDGTDCRKAGLRVTWVHTVSPPGQTVWLAGRWPLWIGENLLRDFYLRLGFPDHSAWIFMSPPGSSPGAVDSGLSSRGPVALVGIRPQRRRWIGDLHLFVEVIPTVSEKLCLRLRGPCRPRMRLRCELIDSRHTKEQLTN